MIIRRVRFGRQFLGIITLIPAIESCICLVALVYSLLSPKMPELPAYLLFMIVHFVVFILTLSLLIYYIRHTFRNKDLASDQKLRWLLFLLFGNVVAMPIYYYVILRQGRDAYEATNGCTGPANL